MESKSEGENNLNKIIISVIIIFVWNTLLMKAVREFIPMIDYDAYIILEKIVQYSKKKGTKEWTILNDDFLEFCKKDRIIIHGYLQKMHRDGLLLDTSYMNNSTTHSVCITEMGKMEIKKYKKKLMQRIVLWFFGMLLGAIVTALITIFLERVF